ncbi:hypothetical protein PR048_002739 [Dryococelus australis]|uniref:Uncharacterized protein n=1 Tax=Dryococelus australis TaxID=614101 RepID=A0ABQ9IL23_9NEOP|nr:hypothetical protein PR048_002739 [Dryococelus australis]
MSGFKTVKFAPERTEAFFISNDIGNAEILVGMLANLCVVAEVCRRVTSSTPVCELMVRMLFCVDTLTLVQLMRLYITCLQRLQNSKENHQVGYF